MATKFTSFVGSENVRGTWNQLEILDDIVVEGRSDCKIIKGFISFPLRSLITDRTD